MKSSFIVTDREGSVVKVASTVAMLSRKMGWSFTYLSKLLRGRYGGVEIIYKGFIISCMKPRANRNVGRFNV